MAFLVAFIFFASLLIWPNSQLAQTFRWADRWILPPLVVGFAVWAYARTGKS
ncbi:MAG: hypothetical protein ACTHM9_16640 [Gemmatimonadales bacterium]